MEKLINHSIFSLFFSLEYFRLTNFHVSFPKSVFYYFRVSLLFIRGPNYHCICFSMHNVSFIFIASRMSLFLSSNVLCFPRNAAVGPLDVLWFCTFSLFKIYWAFQILRIQIIVKLGYSSASIFKSIFFCVFPIMFGSQLHWIIL